jgi:hypothetical protein
MQQLLEHQRDFDFVDEHALSSVLKLENGKFINQSGQSYSSVLISSVSVISKKALDRLQEFATSGGKVIVIGRKPLYIVEETFRDASESDKLGWTMHEPEGVITPAVLEALPHADVRLEKYIPSIKYTHRYFPDADLYFFFNESKEDQSVKTTLAGEGQVQIWDAMTGKIEMISDVSSEEESVTFNLELKGFDTKFIVLGALPKGL